MITHVAFNKLEITTPVHAINGDEIGEQTVTAERKDGKLHLSLSNQMCGAVLEPHEAGYLAGWLTAGMSADQQHAHVEAH